MIGPDLQLGSTERQHLLALRSMPGFEVLMDLMESMVVQFQTAMINADPADATDVLAKHQLAKASAQFYTGVVSRINRELETFHSAQAATQVQPDVTEPMFQ